MSEYSNTQEIRGDLDPSQLVFRQMDRVNQFMTDPETWKFDQSVYALMDNLPPHKLEEVLLREDDYTDNVEEWVYESFAGKQLGSPENPVNGSPRLEHYRQVDTRKLRRVINECFQDSGVFWKVEKVNLELGEWDGKVNNIKPTPVLKKNSEETN